MSAGGGEIIKTVDLVGSGLCVGHIAQSVPCVTNKDSLGLGLI